MTNAPPDVADRRPDVPDTTPDFPGTRRAVHSRG